MVRTHGRKNRGDKDRVEKGVRWEVAQGHTDACRDVLSKPSAPTLHPTLCVASTLHGALSYLVAGTKIFSLLKPPQLLAEEFLESGKILEKIS